MTRQLCLLVLTPCWQESGQNVETEAREDQSHTGSHSDSLCFLSESEVRQKMTFLQYHIILFLSRQIGL